MKKKGNAKNVLVASCSSTITKHIKVRIKGGGYSSIDQREIMNDISSQSEEGKANELVALCSRSGGLPITKDIKVRIKVGDSIIEREIMNDISSQSTSSMHDEMCFCSNQFCVSHPLPWVRCCTCREPMHGRCAGFNSLEELLSVCYDDSNGLNHLMCDEIRCPCCVGFKRDGRGGGVSNRRSNKGLIRSRATLIVTPPSILSQWEREIYRHTKVSEATSTTTTDASLNSSFSSPLHPYSPLKVLVYHGVKEMCAGTCSTTIGSGRNDILPTKMEQIKLIHPHNLADADGKEYKVVQYSFVILKAFH